MQKTVIIQIPHLWNGGCRTNERVLLEEKGPVLDLARLCLLSRTPHARCPPIVEADEACLSTHPSQSGSPHDLRRKVHHGAAPRASRLGNFKLEFVLGHHLRLEIYARPMVQFDTAVHVSYFPLRTTQET